MKIISKTIKLLPLLFMVFAFQACSDDDDATTPVPEPVEVDIVATAQTNAELTTLVTALQLADDDLDLLLQGNGPFTVLAPDNTAFANFLADNGFDNLNEVPTALLAEVLKNHVIAGELTAADLTAAGSGYDNTNATGPGGNALSIYFDTSNGVVFNGMSTVIDADNMATNGVIHIADEVITAPTVVDFAVANPNFSTLVTALTSETPDNDFATTLSTMDGTAPAPFTVFAPLNSAFQALLDSNE